MPSSLRPIFGPSAEQDRDALYSEAQVQQALLDYREQQNLPAPGGRIKLDRWLILASPLHVNFFRVKTPVPATGLLGVASKP